MYEVHPKNYIEVINDTTIMLVYSLHSLILIGTYFAYLGICLAYEIIRLKLFFIFNPSHLSSCSTMKLWVIPMSTISWVVCPLSLISHIHQLVNPCFVLLCLDLLPQLMPQCIRQSYCSHFLSCNSLLSLLDSKLLKLRVIALPLSNFERWIDVVGMLSAYF